MLFLGLGTGIGSALVVRGHIVPMEIGQLGIGSKTFEEELGVRGLKKAGRKKWEKRVDAALERFVSALLLDDVVLGGGNAKKLTQAAAGMPHRQQRQRVHGRIQDVAGRKDAVL